MKLFCLDINLNKKTVFKLNSPQYRIKKINKKNDYPISIFSIDNNIISIFFPLDKAGYVNLNSGDSVAILSSEDIISKGIIIKKYKSIIA